MKFVTFQTPTAGERSGWIHGPLVMDMAAISGEKLPNNLLDFPEYSRNHLDLARQLDESLTFQSLIGANGISPLSDVQLLAPLPRPKSFRDFFAFEKHVLDARRRAGLDMVQQQIQTSLYLIKRPVPHLPWRGNAKRRFGHPQICDPTILHRYGLPVRYP
jgi:hypothetical protein